MRERVTEREREMQTKKKKKKKVVADNEKHNASAYGGLCKAWQNILQGKIRSLSRSSPGGPANINTHYRLGRTSSRTAIACGSPPLTLLNLVYIVVRGYFFKKNASSFFPPGHPLKKKKIKSLHTQTAF